MSRYMSKTSILLASVVAGLSLTATAAADCRDTTDRDRTRRDRNRPLSPPVGNAGAVHRPGA